MDIDNLTLYEGVVGSNLASGKSPPSQSVPE